MDYKIRMRNLREDHDKTQKEIAEMLGTSQTMYSRYERGANEMPIRVLLILCHYYDVSADYLLGLSDRKKWKQIVNNTGKNSVRRGECTHAGVILILPGKFLTFLHAQKGNRNGGNEMLYSVLYEGKDCYVNLQGMAA